MPFTTQTADYFDRRWFRGSVEFGSDLFFVPTWFQINLLLYPVGLSLILLFLTQFLFTVELIYICLLYTSDAADEEDSVDLGVAGVAR